MHGDAPHLVLAPTSIKDILTTTEWSVYLAEYLQTAAIVLTDQLLGQAQTVIDVPDIRVEPLARMRAVPDQDSGYTRYALTDNHISPMSCPGEAGGQYTADGLEHTPRCTPSSFASDHLAQSEKRLNKLLEFDYGPMWADISGEEDAETVLLTWGSTHAAVKEAAHRLRLQGQRVKVVAIRLLAPLRVDALHREIAHAQQVIVVELNQSGQLAQLLYSEQVLPQGSPVLCRPGPLFFRPGEIVSYVRNLQGEKKDAA